MLPAITQSLTVLLGLPRRRQYPCFLLSLAVWLPVLYIPATTYEHTGIDWPHLYWERHIWLPYVVLLTPLQLLSGMEAFLRYCPHPRLAARTSAAFWAFGIVCAMRFMVWPDGNSLHEMGQVALYSRVVTAAALTISIALFGVFGRTANLVRVRDGRHLLIVTALSWSWALPSIWMWMAPRSWPQRLDEAGVLGVRAGLIAIWALTVGIKWRVFARWPRRVQPRDLSGLRSAPES